MKFILISILILFTKEYYVSASCSVSSQTYSTSDGIVIAEVANILTFSAQCDNKQDGATLYADINGKTLPVIRSHDGKTFQISWTVELNKASSGTHSIAIYDEEGFTQLRKAQRGGNTNAVEPLFTLSLYHSGTYKGPWIQTELVATLAAALLWWVAYSAKSKLTA